MTDQGFSSHFFASPAGTMTPRQAAAINAVRMWLDNYALARASGADRLAAFRQQAAETSEALHGLTALVRPFEPLLADRCTAAFNELQQEVNNV